MGLRSIRPTVRQLRLLYTAWKAANDEVRQRIAEQPLLYLKVDDAVKAAEPDDDVTARRDLEAIAGACVTLLRSKMTLLASIVQSLKHVSHSTRNPAVSFATMKPMCIRFETQQ